MEQEHIQSSSNERETLAYNLDSISKLPFIIHELAHKWHGERSLFYENLWYFIQRNFSTSFLKIIFKDIPKSEDESQNKLITFSYQGTDGPRTSEHSEADRKIIDYYYDRSSDVFQFEQEQTDEWVVTGKIYQSSYVIMGKSNSVGLLQKSLLEGLIQGVELALNKKSN